jgi:hypothetical protein
MRWNTPSCAVVRLGSWQVSSKQMGLNSAQKGMSRIDKKFAQSEELHDRHDGT